MPVFGLMVLAGGIVAVQLANAAPKYIYNATFEADTAHPGCYKVTIFEQGGAVLGAYFNGKGGTTSSNPKITIDNLCDDLSVLIKDLELAPKDREDAANGAKGICAYHSGNEKKGACDGLGDFEVKIFITVTLHANDGTDNKKIESIPVTQDAFNIPPNAFERPGYSLVGWSYEEDGEIILGDTVPVVGNNVDLYAQWAQITYDVSFYGCDEVKIGSTLKVPEGLSATAPKYTPAKPLGFNGWIGDFSNVTEKLNIYADCEQVEFSVIFRDDEGEPYEIDDFNNPQWVAKGESAVAPTNPAKLGYRFTGWNKSFNNVIEDLVVDATFIKIWTVNFEDWDGTPIGEPQIVDDGKSATAPADPTRTGYKFTGWNKSFDKITGDFVVTATYDADPYTVHYSTYPSDAANLKNNTKVVHFGDPATTDALTGDNKITILNEDKYEFVNWTCDSENATIISDVNCVAHFNIKSYIIYFEATEGGTVNGEKSVQTGILAYGTNLTGFVPAPSADSGYYFVGWDEDPSSAIVEGSKTYTARFDKILPIDNISIKVVCEEGGHTVPYIGSPYYANKSTASSYYKIEVTPPSLEELKVTDIWDSGTFTNAGTYTLNPISITVQYKEFDVTSLVDIDSSCTPTLTIEEAKLSIKANDDYKYFGNPDPEEFSVALVGNALGTDFITPICTSINRTSGETVGTYTITALASSCTLDNDNYVIDKVLTGVFTIKPLVDEEKNCTEGEECVEITDDNKQRSLTVIAPSKEYTYDKTRKTLFPSIPSATDGNIRVICYTTGASRINVGSSTNKVRDCVITMNVDGKTYIMTESQLKAGGITVKKINGTLTITPSDIEYGEDEDFCITNPGDDTCKKLDDGDCEEGEDCTEIGGGGEIEVEYDGEEHGCQEVLDSINIFNDELTKECDPDNDDDISDVGEIEVCVIISGTNYDDLKVCITVKVTPKTVTVTTRSNSKTSGQPDPTPIAGYDHAGIIDKDKDEVKITDCIVSRANAGNQTIGTYSIAASDCEINSKNYFIKYVGSLFTINAAPYIPPVNPPVNPPRIITPVNDDGDVTYVPLEVEEAEPTPRPLIRNYQQPDTPAVLGESTGTRHWALLNLILTIATVIGMTILIITYFTEKDGKKVKKRKGLIRLLSVFPAVSAVLVFVLTEDMTQPMDIVDKWTIIMALIAAAQLILMTMARKVYKKEPKHAEVE